MRWTWSRVLLWAIFVVVIANYAAQIPYYLRLYYFPHHAPPALWGSLALAATLAWFLVGFTLLLRGRAAGYWLTLAFLATETAFYLYNLLNQMAHGYAPFFHLANPDPVLWSVFAIGYLNLVAGAPFIVGLLVARRTLRPGNRTERRGSRLAIEVAS
ncbi:MAG TPA: hypothetical protein VF808_10700 [Ktedonobacterales bacterium]